MVLWCIVLMFGVWCAACCVVFCVVCARQRGVWCACGIACVKCGVVCFGVLWGCVLSRVLRCVVHRALCGVASRVTRVLGPGVGLVRVKDPLPRSCGAFPLALFGSSLRIVSLEEGWGYSERGLPGER